MVFGAESLSDREKKSVSEGAGKVIELDLGGINPATRAAARNDWDIFFMAGSEEVAFGTDRVNSIDNSVGSVREEVFGIFCGVECLLDITADFGIDLEDSFSKNDRFGLSNGVGGSVNLTVGVGETKIIKIDKGKLTHAGASKGF